MSTWFKKELGDAVMAAPILETLKEKYTAMYGASGIADSPQVLMRYDASGGLHCEVTVYFSPDATALATAVNAEACAEPLKNNLSLLCG
jgi:hypothetical protein